MNQPTTPNTVEDFLPLPTCFGFVKRLDGTACPAYTRRQVEAAILADRAQRPITASPVVDGSVMPRDSVLDEARHVCSKLANDDRYLPRFRDGAAECADEIIKLKSAIGEAVAHNQNSPPASPTVAGSVEDDMKFRDLLESYHAQPQNSYEQEDAEKLLIAHINARLEQSETLAPAAPSATVEDNSLRDWYEANKQSTAPSETEAAVELPPLPEMDSMADIAHARNTPDDWDEDYRNTWCKLQVESRNKMQWRSYALQLRAALRGTVK